MESRKKNVHSAIIYGVCFLIVSSFSAFLMVYPAIAGRDCHIEDGCINETGMIAVFGTWFIPLALGLLALTIIFTIKAIRSRSQ